MGPTDFSVAVLLTLLTIASTGYKIKKMYEVLLTYFKSHRLIGLVDHGKNLAKCALANLKAVFHAFWRNAITKEKGPFLLTLLIHFLSITDVFIAKNLYPRNENRGLHHLKNIKRREGNIVVKMR